MTETLTATELNDRHAYGRSLYGEWLTHAEEQEDVWKGEFTEQTNAGTRSDTFYPRPSEPRSLLKKLDEMLGIRSQKRFQTTPFDGVEDTHQERRRVERLDSLLYGWNRLHRSHTGSDFMRMAGRMTALYGRGPLHTVHVPAYQDPPYIQVRVLDPLTTFPVRGQNGFAWFTRELYMTGQQVKHYFEGIPAEYKASLQATLDSPDLAGQYRMVEYWDSQRCAFAIGTTLIHQYEHGYGALTYREMRLNEMPLEDERWASEGFFGPVLDAIKAKAIMRARLISANETSFVDEIFAWNDAQGQLYRVDSQVEAGKIQEIGPGFHFQTVRKTVNDQLWSMLYQAYSGEISEQTLTKLAYALDLPNVSGFSVSQILSIIRDAIADALDQMEQVLGLVMGDVLRLHEVFAPREGWRYASGTRGRKTAAVTPEDIDGHYDVVVTVKPALPQDIVQKTTIYFQMRKDWGRRAALGIADLGDSIENLEEAERENELEELKANNPEVQQLWMSYLQQKHQRELASWRKVVARGQAREAQRALQATGKEIDQGLSADGLLPAALKTPQGLSEIERLMSQGQTFEQAVQVLQQGLPLGVPGTPVAAPPDQEQAPVHPETQALMAALQGETPNGLTGYEGMNPAVLPPAMQGAQPRQVVDQPNVEVEQTERRIRRGALPEPR